MTNQEIVEQLKKATKIIELCVTELGAANFDTPQGAKKGRAAKIFKTTTAEIDMGSNERNFVKTHASGMNGPKKFVLLLAHMAQGKNDVDIEVSAIAAKWNKMKSKDLMGCAFNAKYPTVAKTAGWVDSKKRGTYHLCKIWKDILSNS